MIRTISGKNLKIYYEHEDKDFDGLPSTLSGQKTPKFVIDGIEPTDVRSNKNPSNSDLKIMLEPAHINDAGYIVNLVAGDIGSTSFIRSVAGAVRSNHYHLTDWHFLYVVTGLMYYYWRPFQQTPPLTSPAPLERVRCVPGDMMWTPPMIEHATYFPRETTLIAINGRARDHHTHEEDVRRVAPLISEKSICPAVMNGVHCMLPFESGFKESWVHFHNGPHEDEDGNTFSF